MSVMDTISGGGRLLTEDFHLRQLAKQFAKSGASDPMGSAINYMNTIARERIPGIDSMGPYETHLAVKAKLIAGTISPGAEAKNMQKIADSALGWDNAVPAG